jgi:cell division initiation protein
MNQLLELPESSFSKSFRGYSTQEVEQFVEHVQNIWDNANQTIAQLSEKIQLLETEIGRLQEAEKALIRALNLSEEAKDFLKNKLEEEKSTIISAAENKAENLLKQAKEEVDKLYLVFEQEKNHQKEQLKNEILEQERTFAQLKEAQKLIASQLLDISKVTINKVSDWEKQVSEKLEVKIENLPAIKRRGRPSTKNQTEKSLNSKKTKKKPVKKALKESNSEGKRPGRPKKVVQDSEVEDGLPTLGKVLEAYAKSNQFPGKIADIN